MKSQIAQCGKMFPVTVTIIENYFSRINIKQDCVSYF